MKIVMPLPNRDFDPSEAAVSWKVVRAAGHVVSFATPDGGPASADPAMLSGEGLDVWGFIPGLRKVRAFGLMLRANADARASYRELSADPAFRKPMRYADLRVSDWDGLVLPGGHYARGMRAYLESAELQRFVADVFDAGLPVGAICHGVVLAARSVSSRTGRSVLYGRRTTALTWALERLAARTGRVFRFWEPTYYRTYVEAAGEPPGYRGVEAEVARALAHPSDFLDVPRGVPSYGRKTNGIARDTATDASPAWVVRDGCYISARWPGDVHTFAQMFVAVLAEFEHAKRSLKSTSSR